MQSDINKQNNKRIAKNTLYLYARKLISLFLAFYTARLLLKALGVEDYGLYGLVGSVVAIFSSLRSLFSSSIQRYINMAKGADDVDTVQVIFSIGVKIHRWISIVFFILAEIGGLFIIPILNIAEANQAAAYWIWQFSIFTAIAGIMTVPYDALIISNERFGAYAVFSLIESFLRLGVVLLLFLDDGSRVILYAALIFGVSVLIRFLNYFYCKKTFDKEAKYIRNTDRDLMKKMTTFAGWQFFGNIGYTLQNSGINVVLNIFGGTIANAARSIAYQVMGAITQFVSDINVSFQPRTMMEFSQGNIHKFYQLMFMSSKASFLMCSVLAFPIFVFAPSILAIWLTDIPANSIPFIRWIMIYVVIRSLHPMFDLFFKTHGNLRKYQTCEFICFLLSIPISWIFLYFGYPLWSAFAVMCSIEFINLIFIALIARNQFNFNVKFYIKGIAWRVLVACSVLGVIGFMIIQSGSTETSIITAMSLCAAGAIVAFIVNWGILFSKKEMKAVMSLVKKK